MALNLEKQLCFYGAFHHNPVNVGIHMTCVPLILLTSFLLLSNTPTLIPLPSWLEIPYLPFDIATLGSFGYAVFYILLEPVAGAILLPALMGWAAYSHHLTTTYSPLVNQISTGIFIFAWVAQFIGHGVFEGRAPALLDNLVQALVMAPFFVFIEALFFFGYRPELQKRVNEGVSKELLKLRQQKAGRETKNGKAK